MDTDHAPAAASLLQKSSECLQVYSLLEAACRKREDHIARLTLLLCLSRYDLTKKHA